MATRSEQLTAMVVSEEQSFGDFLELLLTEEGCHVITGSIVAIRTSAVPETIDLVVLDLDSASKDFEAINTWARENREIPMIVLAWEKESLQELELSPFAFLRKPFDIDKFSAVVRRLK